MRGGEKEISADLCMEASPVSGRRRNGRKTTRVGWGELCSLNASDSAFGEDGTKLRSLNEEGP